MSRNYRSQSPDVWGHSQSANGQFGYGNFRNLQQYANQALTSEGWESNNFSNIFQRRLHANSASTGQLPMYNGNQANEPESPGYENIHLKMDLLKQFTTSEYRAKLKMRLTLPVMRQRHSVLQSVREHQVVLIVGDNGCGKSSQVPQVLLDDYILDCRGRECRIICAQLSKIEALTLAERVACERNEIIGKSVGFLVRGESCSPRPNGSILYCTNGILLKQLHQDSLLKSFNVCILDNTHQPNSYTTQIMELLKLLLCHRHDFKIILLSNNVLEDTFCEYFSDYHVFFIQGTSSPIDLTADDACGENLSSSDEVASIDLPHAPADNVGEQAKRQNDKIAYNKARAFIKKHGQLDPTLLTVKQKQMIRQHQQTIQCYKRTYPRKEKTARTQATGGNNSTETFNNDCGPSTSRAAGVSIKRTISMDEAFMGATTTMFGDDTEELQIAVLDLSDKKGRITPDKWLEVEAKLIFDMTNDNLSKDQISFDKVNWCRGIKVITCHNKRTLEFLKAAIAEVGQRLPGANLKVVPRSTLPSYATVWIPHPIIPLEKILQLIKKQNDGLNTDTWKITARNNKNNGEEYRLVLDGTSIRHIREKQGKIKFGLGTIRIRIYQF